MFFFYLDIFNCLDFRYVSVDFVKFDIVQVCVGQYFYEF